MLGQSQLWPVQVLYQTTDIYLQQSKNKTFSKHELQINLVIWIYAGLILAVSHLIQKA